MTLQYRTRNMSDDRRWNQRVRLSELLLIQIVDRWCRDDGDFPIEPMVASFLFIFSPRCDPFSIPDSSVKRQLFDVVGSPSHECALTWPNHDDQKRSGFIATLTAVLQDTVKKWEGGSLSNP